MGGGAGAAGSSTGAAGRRASWLIFTTAFRSCCCLAICFAFSSSSSFLFSSAMDSNFAFSPRAPLEAADIGRNQLISRRREDGGEDSWRGGREVAMEECKRMVWPWTSDFHLTSLRDLRILSFLNHRPWCPNQHPFLSTFLKSIMLSSHHHLLPPPKFPPQPSFPISITVFFAPTWFPNTTPSPCPLDMAFLGDKTWNVSVEIKSFSADLSS